MKIEYNGKRKKQPIFSIFKGVFKIFKGKVRVYYVGDKIKDGELLVANHANKSGPLIYESYLPLYHAKWGAHQMLGSYKERWKYLRNVLYIQKNGWSKGKATLKATYEAFFSKYIYKGMKVLPTYQDARLARTIKKSVATLSNDISLMIYPEDSSNGYFDVIKKFLPGFVLVMEKYKKATGKDVPVRPIYYHKKKRIILVGEAYYLGEYQKQNLSREEIAETIKNELNQLYVKIESGKFDNK